MASESSGKVHLVTLVTSALEIANSWVNETSESTTKPSEASGVELEGRPLRMGIGSKVSRHVEIAASDDPLERKLMGKLGVGKRPQSSKPMGRSSAGKRPHSFKSQERGSAAPTRTPSELSSGGSDDDSDSRATSFVKKPAAPVRPPTQRKKPRATR
ncbi:unnamed protein product [Spirodela intermedia]|uniref:Uncharacterized protein n=1 Tax=Spirodela intermedia TaxID=51605 RepID=A0A7I8KZZ1_SPIIN|nr:unnamed protein product [Spirodela intermedia]